MQRTDQTRAKLPTISRKQGSGQLVKNAKLAHRRRWMSPRLQRSAGESGFSQRRREKSRVPATLFRPSCQYRTKMQGVRFSPLKALLPSSGHFQSTVSFKCLVETSTGHAVLIHVYINNLPTQVSRDANIEEVANFQSTTCANIFVTAARF